ncbi:Sensor Histidine kinase [Rhodobacterales bacterium HTCC2150]|nr:Sensor Histidine kinase [Rhodobacterales bacterium HTCC2150] [Rhodobacteraceae bacterium HTCC2150]
MSADTDIYQTYTDRRTTWMVRVIIMLLVGLAVTTVWVTNLWMTERFTVATRTQIEVRSALYSGNIVSEVQRVAVIPLLLARDPALISALYSDDFATTSQRLITYQEETGVASLTLLDRDGRTVAATDRTLLGTNFRGVPFYVAATRSNDTVFNTTELETGAFEFTYARTIQFEKDRVGVIVVHVDLNKFEGRWAGSSDAVLLTNSEGRVILSTESRWRGLAVDEALARASPPSAIAQAFEATAGWRNFPTDAYFLGQSVMRHDIRLPFQGWQLSTFTSYSSVRERVNGVLALEIMGFALLLTFVFYLLSRRALSKSLFFQQESYELRDLNLALKREITERERVEKTLEVAEQTIAQSSKLAALGEMSAAVSHELNQPLAAMKTYLAGAKLLLQRRRPEEAMSSFQRIDDLIERMGSITRQLKAHARKGGDAFEVLDMRDAVSSALAMMEPQLNKMDVEIINQSPKEPVLIKVDRIRLEQVIINLLRNALDAMNEQTTRRLEILLFASEMATLAVRDSGTGLEDLDEVFEPFYTTKSPGEGVGLGLAISSGIISDLGGRLTGRNAESGGAVFEIQLPLHHINSEAAE